MGQPEPDQGCFDVPFVPFGLEREVLDTGELVPFSPGEQLKVTRRIGCPRIEGLSGAGPDAPELPQEEPNRDRSPARQILKESGEG